MVWRRAFGRSSSCVILSLILLTIGGVLAPPASAVQTLHVGVVSDNPANWTPNIQDGQVNAILQMGSKVIVGGTFTRVQAAGSTVTLTRNYVFAFDMDTGVIDPSFVPQLNSQVEALAPVPDGQSVFVGGSFSSVNGNTGIRRLARLNLSNGQTVAGFQPNPASSDSRARRAGAMALCLRHIPADRRGQSFGHRAIEPRCRARSIRRSTSRSPPHRTAAR